MFLFGSNSPSTKLRSFVHTPSLPIDSIFAESHSRSVAAFRLGRMDSSAADEYWLAEFVGEDEDWVSKYVQGIHLINGENDDIEERSTPMENIANSEVSSIPTVISSSTITQQRTSTQQKPERIPFNKRWELLKPEIERLYIDENVPLRDIVRTMKEAYNFDAM
jgi:hypothetical protein